MYLTMYDNLFMSNNLNLSDTMVVLAFQTWDWVIMAATIVLSIVIGVYFRFSGGRQKTNEVNLKVLYIVHMTTCLSK